MKLSLAHLFEGVNIRPNHPDSCPGQGECGAYFLNTKAT